MTIKHLHSACVQFVCTIGPGYDMDVATFNKGLLDKVYIFNTLLGLASARLRSWEPVPQATASIVGCELPQPI